MRKAWLMFAVLALSVAAWGTSASALTSPRVFSLLESGPQTNQPIGDFTFEKPPVGGDQFAFVDTLYKWAGTKKGARVGRLQVMITFVTGFGPDYSHNATALIVAQPRLPGGTLMVQGYGEFTADNGGDRFTLPIVGGTGIYANARGYVKVRNIAGSGNNSNVEFHLLP